MFFTQEYDKIYGEILWGKLLYFTLFIPDFNHERSRFMYSSAYVWAKILSYLEERLTSTIVSANFDDAEVVELNENNLIL